MTIELLSAGDQWLSATLNGLYQGMVIAALAALDLRLVRSTNAATRHAIWLGTLLVIVALFPAHYWRSNLASDGQAHHGDNVLSTSVLEVEPSPVINLANPIGKQQASADSGDSLHFDAEWHPPAAMNGEPMPERKTPSKPDTEADVTASTTTEGTARGGFFRRLIGHGNAASWNRAFTSKLPHGTSLILMSAWLVGAGIRLSRLGWRFGQLCGLKRSAFPPQNELSAFLQDLRKKLGVRRNVELKLSRAQRCPAAIGFLHPVILLPADEVQPGNLRDAEPILQHELAHVSRRDDWANLVQQFIQATLFFHPAVWWISKQLTLEREIACDDCVLQQGGRPRAYALMLADMAGRLQRAHPLLAPVASRSKSQLQQRINMILNTHRNTSPRLAKVRLGIITSATAAMALVAVYSWPRLVLAENQTTQSAFPAGGDAISENSTAAVPAAVSVNAVNSDSADAPSAAVSISSEVSSGPKFKPEPVAEDTAPTPAVPPAPPSTPAPAAPPALADLPFTPTPRPGRAPDAQRRVASLEERLARVERMLEKILAKQKDQPMPLKPGAIGLPKGPDENDAFPRGERAKRAKEKEKDYTAKESERAAKLEAKQREREQQRRERSARQGEFGGHLEALQKEREALQREVEKLDQKIESLEHDQERLEQEQEQREQDQERQEQNQEQREQEKQRSGLSWPRGKQVVPATVTARVAATAPVLVTAPVKVTAPVTLSAPIRVTTPVTTTITAPLPSPAPQAF